MSAKTKTPIKVNPKAVAATPAKVAAKPIKSTTVKLRIDAATKCNPVRPVAKATKPGLRIAAAPIPAPASQTVVNSSKQSQLIASLRSTTGVTIEEMMILTGWQAHSLRGVISGVMRKRLGLNVVASPSVNGHSRAYRIVDQVSPSN
jgi:hypothetical protein